MSDVETLRTAERMWTEMLVGTAQSTQARTAQGQLNMSLENAIDTVSESNISIADKNALYSAMVTLINGEAGISDTDAIQSAKTAINEFLSRNNDISNKLNVALNSAVRKADAIMENDLQTQQNSDTNSAESLEIKTNLEYNENISYSLKWHTDLSRTQLKNIENQLRQVGKPEATTITDTANWYKGRVNGKPVFVIYSTENINNPTILYEVSGQKATLELSILLNLLEEIENGESNDGKSAYVNWVSGSGWMQKVNNSQNNFTSMGNGQNNQNAGVLQGQSKRNGSRAFWNVIENLFRAQERRLNESNFSLVDAEVKVVANDVHDEKKPTKLFMEGKTELIPKILLLKENETVHTVLLYPICLLSRRILTITKI